MLASKQADFGKFMENCFFFKNFQFFFIACSAFSVTLERSEAVSFTSAINVIHHRLFLKNPEGALNMSAFVAPFEWSTWLLVLAFGLTMPLIMFMIFK